MSATWRVFGNKIPLQPDKVEKITLAACALHNYLIDNEQIAAGITVDTDTQDGNWRALPHNGMGELGRIPRYAPITAKQVRDEYCNYVNNEGAVHWQENMI